LLVRKVNGQFRIGFLKFLFDQIGVINGFVSDLHEDLHPEAIHCVADGIDVTLPVYKSFDPAVLLDSERPFVLSKSTENEGREYEEQQIFFHFFQVWFDAAKLHIFFIIFVA
jgi:hypothetical protein